MRAPKLDEYTFKVVMDLMLQAIPKPPPNSEALKECTANLLNFSTALFRVLQFIRVNYPSAYLDLKQTRPTQNGEWHKIVMSHILQLEREDRIGSDLGGE
jgi:hypothetical protein